MPTHRQLDPEVRTVCFPEDGQAVRGVNFKSVDHRYAIGDTEFFDLINWVPLRENLKQVPGNVAPLATLASAALRTWIAVLGPVTPVSYMFAWCVNGHLYQVNLQSGVITDVNGATVINPTDLATWNLTNIIINSTAGINKIFTWDGATLTTVFSGQPCQSLCVFSGRLWMSNQFTITFTAGGTFNSLGGDSGSFTVTDDDCPAPITALYPFGGNLYIWGYSWVQSLGGLFDSGSPAVLQFQKNTITKEAGTVTKVSIREYGYSLYYASLYGVWVLLGAQVSLVSYAAGGYFASIPNAGLSGGGTTLSSAYGQIYGIPIMMWQLNFTTDNTSRLVCMTLEDPQNPVWFTLNLGSVAFQLVTNGINQITGQQQVWGADGVSVFQLFLGTGTVTSTFKTKLWSMGDRLRQKTIGRIGHEFVTHGAITVTMTGRDANLNSYSPPLQSTNPGSSGYYLIDADMPITSNMVGVDTVVTGAGATLLSTSVEYIEQPADWGK